MARPTPESGAGVPTRTSACTVQNSFPTCSSARALPFLPSPGWGPPPPPHSRLTSERTREYLSASGSAPAVAIWKPTVAPPLAMTLLPTLEVRMMRVFLKDTVRPWESAGRGRGAGGASGERVGWGAGFARLPSGFCAHPRAQFFRNQENKRPPAAHPPVRRPSSMTCSSTLNTSGCAFSISSNSTTLKGLRLQGGRGGAGQHRGQSTGSAGRG